VRLNKDTDGPSRFRLSNT